jgi:signal transduction histidine kinase
VTPLDELIAYVELGEEDRARLVALHPILLPQFPAIAERFYEAVWKNPGAAGVLSGPEQVERLRLTLIDWMSTGLLGPYDDRFYEKRSRIGRRHVQIGLGHQYMFTAMNVVRIAYVDRILAALPLADAAPTIRSVEKLIDIELAIMVRHYQLDSENKLIARERRAQNDRITAMQTMTAGIAHEVRNPLNAAKLQLELLERRLRKRVDDERLVEPCELAQREIERLTQLLNDFLAFARPPELMPEDRDVAQVVSGVVELERITAEQRGADLTYNTTQPRLIAHVDGGKIHQLVLNLVRNAIEAVGEGGHVGVSLDADEAAVRIAVSDDGPGIPEDIRSRIYEPFFSTKAGGTGLGMSIVHSLVALHGGSIDVQSSPSGTRFDVQIPRRI